MTGASRGIGAATAKALAAKGAHVLLLARSRIELEALVAEIAQNGGKADAYPVDLSDLRQIEACFAELMAKHARVDILVNNAGLGRWLFTEETPGDEAEMMLKLPFLAAFHMTRLVLPDMLKRKAGHIVNVNSPASVLVWGGAAAYASSRWALRGFSEALKVDLHGSGVGISNVVLGEVESNYWEANPGARERLPAIAKMIPRLTTEKAAHYILKAI
ncbi:MAG TPA: SDR family NAD(P)-dependent oxidoreductase, partial [Bacteroidia bacterium]|nr:SDR family NAD(P)-dependent oxidoreductase [Bacteroidia bacterium]